MRARRADDSGTAAVETAIIISVLLTLTFGAIDFGLLAFNSAQASQSAREASRVAMIDPSDSTGIIDAARRGVLWDDDLQVDLVCSPSCTYGATATLTVTWTFPFLTYFGPMITGDSSRQVRGVSTRHIVGGT
jgi:Flp pilus assembly protein TadG